MIQNFDPEQDLLVILSAVGGQFNPGLFNTNVCKKLKYLKLDSFFKCDIDLLEVLKSTAG